MKGVEVGDAFENARLPGTRAHDPIFLNGLESNGEGGSKSSGGTEGGASNGQPIVIRAAMKPIATTLDSPTDGRPCYRRKCAHKYERSDFCPVPVGRSDPGGQWSRLFWRML